MIPSRKLKIYWMSDNMNLQKISKKILIIFMIIEPLLDLYFLYSDNIINIFKFSPATIIRLLFNFIYNNLCNL